MDEEDRPRALIYRARKGSRLAGSIHSTVVWCNVHNPVDTALCSRWWLLGRLRKVWDPLAAWRNLHRRRQVPALHLCCGAGICHRLAHLPDVCTEEEQER